MSAQFDDTTDSNMNNDVVADPEREIARDLVRKGLLIGPVLIVICGAIWQMAGLASASLAVSIVLVNFLLASSLITWSVRISPEAMMAGVLGGYLLRLALLTAVVLPVRNLDWFSVAPFAITLIVTHLGLLAWELRYISATLAYPGLAPRTGSRSSLTKGASSR
ncbi:MAG: hypothetical protein ACI81L_001823 [Verrucomicrobiales bacterium]|jgi:hypothetical protein